MKKRLVVLALLLFVIIDTVIAVELTSPEFGVSQEKTFDVSVTTTVDLECRYSSPFEKSFSDMTVFDVTGSTSHTVSDFTAPAFGTEYDFFVNCEDTETIAFKVKADNSAPSIDTFNVDPDIILESPLETKLIITTNEDTVCKYDEEATEYHLMGNFVNGSDTNENDYRDYHEKLLTNLEDSRDYGILLRCRDLSGRNTSLAIVTFEVNTSAEAVIINFTPEDNYGSSDDDVVFSVATNKKSVCKYGNESNPTHEDGSFNVQGRMHETTVEVSEGTHTYYFKCIFEGPQEVTAQTTFTVDKTPPDSRL